jgi:FkbM family methyltransferase
MNSPGTSARSRLNRLLSRPIAYAIDHFPALQELASSRIESRRLPIELARLRKQGLVIKTVYDIGAHQGAWTREMQQILPGAEFFLFEANGVHAESLKSTGARYFTVVLSSEEKPVEFFEEGTSGDSYLRELTERYAAVRPTVRRAETLDSMIDHHALPLPDLMKVDVQGAELDILRGGERALSHANLVLLECPIVPYNLGAPSIDEYFRFMDDQGFTVLKFVGELWPDRRMRHVDVLFARVEQPSVSGRG